MTALALAAWLGSVMQVATPTVATTADPAAVPGTRGAIPALVAGSVRVRPTGTVRPAFGVVHRGAAADRDRWGYGADGSRLDLGIDADAGGGVSGVAYVRLQAEGSVDVERAVVRWQPIAALRLGIGRDRVPLSAQSATPTSARLFPDRIALDRTFVLPADVGIQVALATSRVTVLGGVWNGVAGDAMLGSTADERGVLLSARAELTPLGSFPFDESARPDSVRIGIGAGATYRSSTAYDALGTAGSRARDLRAAAAVRLAWRGLHAQTEVLRRQITDDLSMRPDVATGWYAQAAYRVALGRVDLAPLARVGLQRIRQLSAPASGSSIEAGLSAFPFARGSDRLQLSLLFTRTGDPDLGASESVTGHIRLGF